MPPTPEWHKDVVMEQYPPVQRGGQHVGIGYYGVKATHTPTGLVAIVQTGRSQFVNRQIALDMIEGGLSNPRISK